MARPNSPRPAYEKQSAFVTLHYRGDENTKPHSVEMFPIDANEALARDPENWSREPFDDSYSDETDPGDESRQSAHGNSPEEIYENDAATAMREDGFAAEPAGSKKGRRPGSYSPSETPRRSPVQIVEPAKEKPLGRTDPKLPPQANEEEF